MLKTGLLSKQHLNVMRTAASAMFAQADASFLCSWRPAQGRRKRGTPNYSTPVHDVVVYIRGAVEARRSDALLGVTITGSHIGIAERENEFGIGDTLVRADGSVFEVVGAQKYMGELYWILDLEKREKDPADLP